MLYLDEMQDTQKEENLILLCGGTETIKDFYSIENRLECQLAGVNQHALMNDSLVWVYAHDERMIEFLIEQKTPIPIISHQHSVLRENDIHCGIGPDLKLSGAMALWVAGYLGYKKIYVCGADSYAHPFRDYWHQFWKVQEQVDTRKNRSKENGGNFWRKVLQEWSFESEVIMFSGLKEFLP